MSLRVFCVSLLAVLVAASGSEAQGKDITLAVLPFGVAGRAYGGRGGTAQVAQEVVTFAQEAEVYTVLDRSDDDAIERELQRAQSYRNFDSKVKLEGTARLNATALLIGVIEEEAIERHIERGQRPKYSARLALRLKIVHTQTGQLIKSKAFEVQSGSVASREVDKRCKNIPKFACDAIREGIEKKASGTAISGLASTEDEARRNALEELKAPITEFLQDSYGAVLAASKRK